jgi:hypothetical protein
MSLIKQVATFRGAVLDKAVTTTKNGYPQLVMPLKAVELYDPDLEQWVDWSEEEENEITAFLCLFGGNGEITLSGKQVMKVLGWSGESFQELDEIEFDGMIQFRTAENTYEGNTSIQVAWIDVEDAEPGNSIRRLDKDELKKLDAKYATGLRKASGGPKPKSVPLKAPKKTTPPKETEKPAQTEEKTINAEKAWEICNERKPEKVTDEKLAAVWVEITDALGDDEKITRDGKWADVCHQVLQKIGVVDDIPF